MDPEEQRQPEGKNDDTDELTNALEALEETGGTEDTKPDCTTLVLVQNNSGEFTPETPSRPRPAVHNKYSAAWEYMPELRDWIEAVPGDSGMAWCRRCHAGITCHPRNVMAHAVCQKHRRNAGATPMSAPETVPRRLWRGARARPDPPSPIPYWQRRYYDYRSGQKSASARQYPGKKLEADSGDSGSTRDASVQINLVTSKKRRVIKKHVEETPYVARKRQQKYRPFWETIPELKDWIEPVPNDEGLAWCRRCHTGLTSHLKNLITHAASPKHKHRAGSTPMSAPEILHRRVYRGGRAFGYRPDRVPTHKRLYDCRPPKSVSAAELPVSTSPRPDSRQLQPYAGSGDDCASPASPEPPPDMDEDREEPPVSPDRCSPLMTLDVSDRDSAQMIFSTQLNTEKLGFIGAGCIAQAALKAILDKGVFQSRDVLVSAPSDRNLEVWRRWGCSTGNDNAATVRGSDVLVLAVPPRVMETVLQEVGGVLTEDKERCIVSFVTGWTRPRIERTLQSHLSEGCESAVVHVVRCVPNLAVSLGEGSCVYCGPAALPPRWQLVLETMLAALGSYQRVDETLADAYSGAFSCGTGFVMSFIEALASGAVNLGVTWQQALDMAVRTTAGAARLALQSNRSPGDLRRDVSAAGGNALAGLMALQKHGLDFAVMSAVQASAERSRELGLMSSSEEWSSQPSLTSYPSSQDC